MTTPTPCARCSTTDRPIHVVQRQLCRRCYDWLIVHDALDTYPPLRPRRSQPRARHGGAKLAFTEKCPCDPCEHRRDAKRQRDAAYIRPSRTPAPAPVPLATPPRGPVARACTPRHPRGECGICDTRRDADAAHKRAVRNPDLETSLASIAHQQWRDDALCTQTDPETFFPEKGGSTAGAKRVCNRCPVQAQCLEYALTNNEHFGVWGGYSERERREIARGRAA